MGQLEAIQTGIKDLIIIENKVFKDERGYFTETYNETDFFEIGINNKFVQDNESYSKQGTLRGLHFQNKFPQGKLVRVTEGEVFDVAVDLRKESSTYGKWFGVYLNNDNKRQFFVPEGFAHGFLVMSEYAKFNYKCTNFYNPNYEDGIIWNDKTVNVDWPTHKVKEIIISDKDKILKEFII